MNSNRLHKIEEYKVCLARDCKNEASYQLKILFAKKPGWFCDSCMKYFQKGDLIEQIIDEKVENGDEHQVRKL
ncbi:MAG TPA: hypothetical protein VIY08_03880 [Candidatus Nitrosocosmicus sp.]